MNMQLTLPQLAAEEVAARAPAAFAQEPAPRMSARYGFVDTATIMQLLGERSFVPVRAKQDKVRARDPRFARHMISFQSRDLAAVAEGAAEVIVTNSHNGTTGMTIRMGLFRLVCSNGLVVGQTFERYNIRHTLDAAAEVDRLVASAAAGARALCENVERWRAVELTPRRALEFASEALRLRMGAEAAAAYDAAQLLRVQRAEDDSMSLWSVMNRVQEHASKGSFTGRSAAGRALRARALSGITKDIEFNAALWDLTEEFAK